MKGRKTLATDKSDQELRGFLLDVANAEDRPTDATANYFFSRYPTFFPSKDTDIKSLLPFLGRRMTSPEGLLLEGGQILHRAIVGEMREWLRAIWDAEDDYTKEWRLFNLQLHLHRVTDLNKNPGKGKRLQPPPLQAPINQASRYLHRSFGRLKKVWQQRLQDAIFHRRQREAGLLFGRMCRRSSKNLQASVVEEGRPRMEKIKGTKKSPSKSAQSKSPISRRNKKAV